MKLYSYKDIAGKFDYERYRSIQEQGNIRKINAVWAREENIKFLSDYLRGHFKINNLRGVCHGTRRGLEQQWFRQYLPSNRVIGTEISKTAADFPHTLQMDFHDPLPPNLDKPDFIYTNSLDHSYDPRACLQTWMTSLNKNGLCLIEHSSGHEPDKVTELDPFGVTIKELIRLLPSWGYPIQCLLALPDKEPLDYLYCIVAKNNERC